MADYSEPTPGPTRLITALLNSVAIPDHIKSFLSGRRWAGAYQGPALLIGLIALPILILLALYPFLIIVRQSFGQLPTLDYWQALILGRATPAVPFWTPQHSQVFLWQPLQHSLIIAGLTTLLATTLGVVLAWLSTVTDLRYTSAFWAVAMFHLILPPFILAIAWVSLARSLGLPEALTYGPAPMVVVLTLHFYAFAFLLTGVAIRNLDANLIEAAQVHGIPDRQIIQQIALPLLFPTILSSAAFIAFSSLAAFAPMQILGGGRQPYYVLATQVYSLYQNSLGDPRVGYFAVGLALVLTVVSIPPFLLFLRLLGQKHNYRSIEGRGHRPWRVRLGRWRNPLSILCFVLSLFSVIVPLGVLLFQSLSPTLELSINPAKLTLDHYRALLATDQYLLSLGNSFLLAMITATVGVLVTMPLAYSLYRSRSKVLCGSLYALTFLPFLLPGVVLGLTYFVVISKPFHLLGQPISLRFLYGSLLLAAIVSLVKHLPFGVQTHISTLIQIDPVLEEAAYLFRASFWRGLKRILLPLVCNGSLVAWILLFIFVFKEIDLLTFVYAPLAFSTGDLNWQNLTHAPPIMYRVFTMINSEEHPELYTQGTALLLIVCLVLLTATLLIIRMGWRPFNQPRRR